MLFSKRETHALILILGLSGFSLWMMMSKPLGRLPTATAAPALTVTSNADDNSVGTLRQVIAAAASGDTINFSLPPASTITLTMGELLIDKNLTIVGPGATSLTISANHASRVLEIAAGVTAATSDLTISNGSLIGSGGGILNDGTLTITNCVLSGNTCSGFGGGIFNDGNGATLIITNSTLSSNLNGGIFNSFGTMTITNSTFSNNSAPSGGGLSNNGGMMTITNSTLSNNSATSLGGGIFNAGPATIINSTVSGNSVTDFSGDGGGIFHNADTLSITNCTLSGNSVTGTSLGGGFHNNGGTVNFKNSIVANSTGGDCGGGGIFNASGVNFATDSSCAGFTQVPSAGPGGLNLGPLQVNAPGTTATHALLFGSVAIDAVSDCTDVAGNAVTTDQRGAARPIDGDHNGSALCDAGAYEAPECALACPANQIASPGATGCCAVVNYPDPTADPACGELGCTPPAGACFPIGVTMVTCSTVQDGPSCTFTVTVVDNNPPSITCPANIATTSPAGQCDAVVTFPDPTASDECSATTVSCSPQSGSVFPAGTTTVTCKATDVSGNMATCTFTVKVNDLQPPQITCPSNVTASAASCPPSANGIVSFATPTASDNCPGVTTTCIPPSGSSFPVGTTTVTCTATDAAGNTATCTFTVTLTSGCLQDDSNPANVVQFNAITGQYRFCCNGTVVTGTGTVMLRGCSFTLQHNAPDRRVLINVDFSVKKGTASLQSPPGTTKCNISDRNLSNNSNCSSCQ